MRELIKLYEKYPAKKGGTYHHVATALNELAEFHRCLRDAKRRKRAIRMNVRYGPTHGAIFIGFDECLSVFDGRKGGGR